MPRGVVPPESWSAKEIIGHLIDSAANNHARFVRAQLEPDLVSAGYDQEQWVKVQAYQDASWSRLLDLWSAYNLHIAHVMESASEDAKLRPRARHNLDKIAWTTVSADQPTTLDYFMRDYVGHLRHHLRQIAAWSVSRRNRRHQRSECSGAQRRSSDDESRNDRRRSRRITTREQSRRSRTSRPSAVVASAVSNVALVSTHRQTSRPTW